MQKADSWVWTWEFEEENVQEIITTAAATETIIIDMLIISCLLWARQL